MFFKKNDDGKDNQRLKAMIRILARRILMAKPEAALAISALCAAVGEADGSNLFDLINGAVDEHSDVLKKDPTLAQDVKDLLVIMGVEAPRLKLGEVKELMQEVCSLVN